MSFAVSLILGVFIILAILVWDVIVIVLRVDLSETKVVNNSILFRSSRLIGIPKSGTSFSEQFLFCMVMRYNEVYQRSDYPLPPQRSRTRRTTRYPVSTVAAFHSNAIYGGPAYDVVINKFSSKNKHALHVGDTHYWEGEIFRCPHKGETNWKLYQCVSRILSTKDELEIEDYQSCFPKGWGGWYERIPGYVDSEQFTTILLTRDPRDGFYSLINHRHIISPQSQLNMTVNCAMEYFVRTALMIVWSLVELPQRTPSHYVVNVAYNKYLINGHLKSFWQPALHALGLHVISEDFHHCSRIIDRSNSSGLFKPASTFKSASTGKYKSKLDGKVVDYLDRLYDQLFPNKLRRLANL